MVSILKTRVIKPKDLIGSTVKGKDALNKEHIIPLIDRI